MWMRQVEVLVGRGALMQRSEAYDRAEADFSAAVRLDPANPQALIRGSGRAALSFTRGCIRMCGRRIPCALKLSEIVPPATGVERAGRRLHVSGTQHARTRTPTRGECESPPPPPQRTRPAQEFAKSDGRPLLAGTGVGPGGALDSYDEGAVYALRRVVAVTPSRSPAPVGGLWSLTFGRARVPDRPRSVARAPNPRRTRRASMPAGAGIPHLAPTHRTALSTSSSLPSLSSHPSCVFGDNLPNHPRRRRASVRPLARAGHGGATRRRATARPGEEPAPSPAGEWPLARTLPVGGVA